MDSHDGAEKWKRRKRLHLHFFLLMTVDTTGCAAAVYSCGGWSFLGLFFFLEVCSFNL